MRALERAAKLSQWAYLGRQFMLPPDTRGHSNLLFDMMVPLESTIDTPCSQIHLENAPRLCLSNSVRWAVGICKPLHFYLFQVVQEVWD